MTHKAASLPLDQIIQAIRAEAKALQPNLDPDRYSAPRNLDKLVDIERYTLQQTDQIPMRREYRLHELISFDDLQFVKNAYRALLHREADPDGLDTYVAKLRQGVSKTRILGILRYSDEGKRKGVVIKGLERFPEGQFNGAKSLLRPIVRLLNRLDAYLHARDSVSHAEVQALAKDLATHQNHVIDRVTENFERLEAGQQLTANLARQVNELNDEVALLKQRLVNQQQALDTARIKTDSPDPTAIHDPFAGSDRLQQYYLAFEDACRGSRTEILNNLAVYAPHLANLPHPLNALDLGCGRGEWLELLTNLGVTAEGVDLNASMVSTCIELGYQATQADALAYLKASPDNHYSLISGFHIIEHLPFEVLFEVVQQAWRALKPGGTLLFETPNPENILVGSHTFYHDPTHRNPITPTSIQFLCSYHGFVEPQILRLHPYPESARVNGIDPLTERVNGHLCGPQDFAILVQKPSS